jgi:hypothetical protein
MRYAAKGGHKNIVEFCIFKGANDWNEGAVGATEGGYKDLANFFKGYFINFDLNIICKKRRDKNLKDNILEYLTRQI